MAAININLLPVELEKTKKDHGKKGLFLKLNVIALVVIVLVSATILTIRITQNITLTQVNNQLEQIKGELTTGDSKQKEELVTVLRDRLNLIGATINKNTPSSYAFDLITSLKPEDVLINSFVSDKDGKVLLTVQTTNNKSLDTFLNNLNDPQVNQGKVINVNMEGLSRGVTGLTRVELTINLAPATIAAK